MGIGGDGSSRHSQSLWAVQGEVSFRDGWCGDSTHNEGDNMGRTPENGQRCTVYATGLVAQKLYKEGKL